MDPLVAGWRWDHGVMHIAAVPGNGGSPARWELLPAPLAEGTTLHAITLPGFDGEPLPSATPTLDDFVEAMIAAVEALPRPRVVFGTGIGGSIALQAAQRPEWADGFILHAPVGPSLDTRLLPKLMRPNVVRSLAKAAISSPIGRAVGRRRYSDVPPATIDRVLGDYARCDAFGPMWDILNADWWNALEPVREPAILLWGAGDGVLDADHADAFRRVLPDAEIRTEPHWAHYPMLEQPEHFAATIDRIARELVG